MNIFVGCVTLFFALLISAVAAYFSIVGLATLFSAVFLSVIIMGIVLESGKLVAAAWLHANWHNKKVNIFHKFYLITAVIALMIITSIGIYGYLSKGYLEQSTPIAGTQIKIEQIEQTISIHKQKIDDYKSQIEQMDKMIDVYLNNDYATRGVQARKDQASERERINDGIQEEQARISELTNELIPLKLSVNDVESKLGPIKYVAELFGWTDTDSAVRLVIVILMFAFDPLAVVLVISSVISFGNRPENKEIINQDKLVTDDDYGYMVSDIKNTNINYDIFDELYKVDDRDDYAILVDILEKHPEFLDILIEETNKNNIQNEVKKNDEREKAETWFRLNNKPNDN